MLVKDEESNRAGSTILGEVAQVHECALREQRKISVTEPDEEAAGCLIINAWVLTHSLGATEACTGVEHKLMDTFFRVEMWHS